MHRLNRDLLFAQLRYQHPPRRTLPGAPPRDRVAAPNLSPREREVLHQLAGRHSTTPTDDRPVQALRCASRQVLPTGPGLRGRIGCVAAAALVLTSMLRDRVRAEHRPRMLARKSLLSLLAVRVAREERQEAVRRHGEITPGAALCIAVECAAV